MTIALRKTFQNIQSLDYVQLNSSRYFFLMDRTNFELIAFPRTLYA